ncbi:LysR family transcriptional regulator [Collimonas pratensis]|nr:LysR family transcriptional regulator [Collimonas pratensis]
MESRKLQHMLALAAEGSFARAAERSHLSQSAFSRSIQALEKELDLVLFERTPKAVLLTSSGRVVARHAQNLLSDTRAFMRDVDLLKGGEYGEISFGLSSFPSGILLPSLLTQFMETHPKISVRTYVAGADQLLRQLQAEQIDFFVADVRGLRQQADFTTRWLDKEDAGFFVRPDHPLCAQPTTTVSALLQYHLALPSIPTMLEERAWNKLGLSAQEYVKLICDDVTILKRIAQNSDACLFSTEFVLREELALGQLRPLHVVDLPPMNVHFGIVRMRARSIALVSNLLEQMIVDKMALLCSTSRQKKTDGEVGRTRKASR